MGCNKMRGSSKAQWDEIYRTEQGSPAIQNGLTKLTAFFKRKEVQKILDLGCGSGRDLIYLAELGFELYGLDFSEEGIRAASTRIQEKNLPMNLKVSSIYEKLPYEDQVFDAIIGIRTLHHGTIENIRALIQEIERILKPHGLIYITVRKRIAEKKRLASQEIAPRTYIPLEGKEKGVIHYLFNKSILKKEFSRFKILELGIIYGPQAWEAYYHLLGELI